jgi:putative spermidine/putrescine transport system ATP-binding protein
MPARSLSLKSVVKSYVADHKAVDDVSLEIAPGEFLSFLGPSGSGKTTTLMMIAGFERPTAGDIRVDGRAIDDVPPYARNIGMVFQNYALFPHMTVQDNVGFPLRMRGVPKSEARQKIAAALVTVGLTGFDRRYPSQLSGGQQQRVALARALVFEPDVVLLDEPLGALDKTLREQMQVELKRIHRELGVTMIYVTHDQTEAMTMSDRIAVFNAGRIEQIGAPAEVYFKPRTRFVASFIGDSNLLDGKVSQSAEGVVDVPGFGPVQTGRRDLAPNRPVCLLARPEMFRLTREAAAPSPTRNNLVINDTVNYGDSVLVLGRSGDTPIRVRVPGIDMLDVEPGQTLGIEWSATRIHVVDTMA